MADIIAQDQNSTVVRLAQQAAQAEQDAASAAAIAARPGATTAQQKAAADAAAWAEQARTAASEAAELAARPVTGAPATMSRSGASALCSGPGCTAATTGRTAGVPGESRTVATCTAAASGCAVTSDASTATGRDSGEVDAAGTPVPGTSGSGRTSSQAVCPEAGCTAALSGAATADGTTSRSAATGDTACTGTSPCIAQIGASSAAGTSAPDARADERFATTSAAVAAECDDGSATGCATRTSSTTVVAAPGDGVVHGRASATCAAAGGCLSVTGGLTVPGLAQLNASCAGAGCRARTEGAASAPVPGGLNRASARTDCSAGAGGGQCGGISQVSASGGGAEASTSCESGAGAACRQSYAASSTAAGVAGGNRVAANAECGAVGGAGSGWCSTAAVADADAGLAMAAAACRGSSGCSHSYRAESRATAAGADGRAVGHGGGGVGGGHVTTTASAAGGPGFAQASASCDGTAGVRCSHSYSAAASASAAGARASASGSGGGGVGGGGVAVSAQASSGPGWASASASCSGAANCRHSYSASASQSASYQGPGPGGSTVRHWARASASGSGGGGQGGGGVAVSAHAGAGPNGASAGASCSGARNCSASFESHSVADAYHDPKHYAHGEADCSGSGSGGFCATSASARADAKSAAAGASCSGSAGAACHHSYSAHSDADLKTPATTANGGADCGDSGGFGGGGCGTVAYAEVDENGVTVLRVACEGPGCRYSGVADARTGNLIAQGDAHQQCGQVGEGSCTLGVKAVLGHDRERENFEVDAFGFCVGTAGANCQGTYSTHIDLGPSTVGDCSGVGSGGCHSETLSGKGHPVVSYGICIEGLACDWEASTHSDAGLTTADRKLSAEANADCSTTSAEGTGGCVTSAGYEVRNNEMVGFASCQGGVGPNCRYFAQTTAHDLNGMNTADATQPCGQQAAGHCGVSSYAGALTDQNLRGEGMEHHGEAIAGNTCAGSFGTDCSGGSYRTHVDSDRDTWSNCTGTGEGRCHGVADPWNAHSTGTGSGHIESHSPDEHESGSFTTYGPLFTPITIGANTHDTVGRGIINFGRAIGDEAEDFGNAVKELPGDIGRLAEDTATQFSNWGHLAWTGEEEPRRPGETDEEYDARVWPLKNRWDTSAVGTQYNNFLDAVGGDVEPRLPGETDDQYNARVWPLKHQWNTSMDAIGEIASGDTHDLYWDPINTVSTAVSGPAMIIPAGGVRGLVAGGRTPFGSGERSALNPDGRGDVDVRLGPDANCVNAVCAYGAAHDPDDVIPGDIPKANPSSHDPAFALASVEGVFDGRFTDSTRAQFDRNMADAPNGTEVVAWAWPRGAATSHMLYGLKSGGDVHFFDQRGRLSDGQAGAQLENLRMVLVGGTGGNIGAGPDLSDVPPVGHARQRWDEANGPKPELAGISASKFRVHILYGDDKGGGHWFDSGQPNKTVFPEGWNEDRIINTIEDVARDPDEPPVYFENENDQKWYARGTRDGVEIEVVMNTDGVIRTGYPLGGEGVMVNDEEGWPQPMEPGSSGQ